MNQFQEYNLEDLQGEFTRPTLDLYLCNKYWNFMTKGASAEEVADLENAKEQLTHYEGLYDIMEYANKISQSITCLMVRQANTNVANPLTIYRNSAHNQPNAIAPELEMYVKAYYGLLEDCKDHPEWFRKVEEDLGQAIAFIVTTIDETSRDALVASSPIFARFDMEKQKFFK